MEIISMGTMRSDNRMAGMRDVRADRTSDGNPPHALVESRSRRLVMLSLTLGALLEIEGRVADRNSVVYDYSI
jgi:hypothetical protein